jgi:hypothetical protein
MRKESDMTHKTLWRLTLLTMWAITATSLTYAAAESGGTDPQLLSGDRVLLGIVEDVRSDQARIGTGEVQPRFTPMGVRKEKGLPELKKGDLVEITVNDQNLLVDVHLGGESGHHHVVVGQTKSKEWRFCTLSLSPFAMSFTDMLDAVRFLNLPEHFQWNLDNFQ